MIYRNLTSITTQDWFETHQQEGIRVNLIGALNVVDACYVSGPIHCTTFGTGFMYTYDTDHPQNSGIGFKVRTELLMDVCV